MAKEGDQTRWVGIRPTDPSEDIPTTTRKLAPAIGDLQAVKDVYADISSGINVDCSVEFARALTHVAADEIWIVTNISMCNEDTLCDMVIFYTFEGDRQQVKGFYSVPPGIYKTWTGLLVLKDDDFIQTRWYLGGVTDTVRVKVHGYKVGVY